MATNTSFVDPSSTGENSRRIEESVALSSSNHNLSTILTSAAGAGARRATAIAQLYFRLANYPPLTIVVVDALCVVFGADGASIFQLVDYLGVPEDAIQAALQSIPSEVCCTSDDCVEDGRNSLSFATMNADEQTAFSCYSRRSTVPQERPMKDVEKGESPSTSFSPTERDDELHDCELRGVRKTTEEVIGKKEEEEKCYYLNYKRLLPFAYAHVCRLLLPLCVLPFSFSSFQSSSNTGAGKAEDHCLTHTVESDVKQPSEVNANTGGRLHSRTSFPLEMTPKGREGNQESWPSSPPVAGEWNGSILLLSSGLQQRLPDVHEAIMCRRCNMWVDANECVPLSTFRSGHRGGASTVNVSSGIGSSSRNNDGWKNDSVSWGTNRIVSSTRLSLTPCPICGEDVVQSTVLAILAHFQESLACGVPLLVVPPSSSSPVGDLERTKPTKLSPSLPSSGPSTFVTRSLPSSLQCPLAKDPLLVQQVLIFFELFRIPFACLADDDAYVVDASEILTDPEMLRRLNNHSTVRGEGEGGTHNRWGGGSSAVSMAEQFRAVHRQSQSVRVRLVSSPSVAQRKIRENVRKLLKRSSLPPWMRRDSGSTTLSASYRTSAMPGASAKHFSSSRQSRKSTSTTLLPTADESLREKVRQISTSENGCSAFDVTVFAEEEFEPVEWLSPRYQLHQK